MGPSSTFRGRMSTLQLLREQATRHIARTRATRSYYTIHADGRTAQNAVWSYEQPLEAVAAIGGYMAFYPNRVDSLEQLSG